MKGYQSGFSNTTGSNNVNVGYQAGYTNTGNSNNTMIGYMAGYLNSNGYNTFIGSEAGYNNTGGYNNFEGYHAGYVNSSGAYNDFNGYYAGVANTTGASNSFFGANAGKSNTTSSNNSYFGEAAGMNSTGNSNCYYGSGAGLNNTSGTNNVFVGMYSGYNSSTGSNNVFIGYSAGNNETGNSKLYIANSNTTTPLLYGDFSSPYLVVNGNNANGKVFYVNGAAGGSTAWTSSSDQRLKKNIQTIDGALNKVLQLRGVNYEWRDSKNHEDGIQLGFIAQEAKLIIPEVVRGVETDSTFLNMQYAPITALLVEAVKEQQKLIEQQKVRIAELESKVNDIDSLKTANATLQEQFGLLKKLLEQMTASSVQK